MIPWVMTSSLRWSEWSAAEPVQGSNSSCGANCSAMTTPTAEALWRVSTVSTSQSWAVRCTPVPMLEISAPPAQSR